MVKISIFQLNDSHGYIEAHNEVLWTANGPEIAQMGGFSRVARILDQARSDHPDAVLAFDNGDTFHGTPAVVRSKGECLVPILNAMQFDAMTGHWDFAYGPEQVAHLSDMLTYPMLAANAHPLSPDAPRFASTVTCLAGGVLIGVIGLAATILDKTMPPGFATGLRFTDGVEETRDHAARLRQEGCELIVVLSHLGLPQDCALARSVDGIDVILSGHTHNRLEHPWCINGALIIQSGCHGSFLGRLDLTIKNGKVTGHRHSLIAIDETLPEDPQVARLVAEALEPIRPMQARTVGHTDHLLHRGTALDAPMDDLILAAIAKAAGTDIAFSNGWRYGAPVAAGPITEYDLWCMVPMNPPVQRVSLTGAEIVAMMEENLEATFSADPFRQRGGYVKRFHGLTFNVKLENPAGHRIEKTFGPSGELVLPGTCYRAAFITIQGVPKRFGTDRATTGISTTDALEGFLANNTKVPDSGLGRLRIC